MMLSRAAERVYWLGRYLERAEGTARVVQQYTQMLLDLPAASGVDWTELPKIFGAAGAVAPQAGEPVEVAVIDWLLANPASTVSVKFSIAAARDNVRNTRDLLPIEVWESVNELHAYAGRHLESATRGEDRFEVLSECIGRCQQIDGALGSTMSHHSPLHFLRLGQHIERADMTTRVIDVAADYLAERSAEFNRFSASLWTNTLRTLSALQMYRQYAQIAVSGPAVIAFLAGDAHFPRAIRHNVIAAAGSARQLPQGEAVAEPLASLLASLDASRWGELSAAGVSESMDRIQRALAAAHAVVEQRWFLPAGT